MNRRRISTTLNRNRARFQIRWRGAAVSFHREIVDADLFASFIETPAIWLVKARDRFGSELRERSKVLAARPRLRGEYATSANRSCAPERRARGARGKKRIRSEGVRTGTDRSIGGPVSQRTRPADRRSPKNRVPISAMRRQQPSSQRLLADLPAAAIDRSDNGRFTRHDWANAFAGPRATLPSTRATTSIRNTVATAVAAMLRRTAGPRPQRGVQRQALSHRATACNRRRGPQRQRHHRADDQHLEAARKQIASTTGHRRVSTRGWFALRQGSP